MAPSLKRSSIFLLVRTFLVFAAVIISTADALDTKEVASEEENVDKHNVKVAENRFAAQIFALIDHYKQEDPVGIPSAPVKDPMAVPNMVRDLSLATLTLKEVKVYGLSKFRIRNVKFDLKAMKVEGKVTLDEMLTKGNYTMSSFMSESKGPFRVILMNVTVLAKANLRVQLDGQLATDSIFMDITFKNMKMDFQNLGFMGSVFQNIMNLAPNLVFDGIKPYMVKEADVKMRGEIDKNIKKILGDRRLPPNTISPMDMAFAEAGNRARAMGYDPFHVPDYKENFGFFSVATRKTYIAGVSSFYRAGDIIVSIENNTVSSKFLIGTKKIEGSTQWEFRTKSGLISRTGYAQFSVEYIKVGVIVSQALDTRRHPEMNDLQIYLGNILVKMEGGDIVDQIFEYLLNILTNVLRHQITDAIEHLLKTGIQEKFNQVNVENTIKENFHKFEAMASGKAPIDFDFKF